MVTVIQNQKVEKRRDTGFSAQVHVPHARTGTQAAGFRWGGSAARLDPLFGPRLSADDTAEALTWPRPASRSALLSGLDAGWHPAHLAGLLLVLGLLVWWAQPASLIRALPYCSDLGLPRDLSSDNLLIEYSRSFDADHLPDTSDEFDPARLEALALQEYVVQPGDSLSSIAKRFNLNIDTIISFNNITDPRRIRVGQTYRIPNRDGLQYVTREGDTLESIAKKYDVGLTAILDGNSLETETLVPKTTLFIPGARLNPTDLKLMLGELFRWPVKGFYLTSGYGYRVDPFTGQRRFHNGLDIGAYHGAPVAAAQAGRVVMVEHQVGNYGKVVAIQHERGFRTLYAHLDSFSVHAGQYVTQGQKIGTMGNTGRSTGTHLHFTVIRNGATVNPRKYLP